MEAEWSSSEQCSRPFVVFTLRWALAHISSYLLNNVPLSRVTSCTDLDVCINSVLSFSEHINNLTVKRKCVDSKFWVETQLPPVFERRNTCDWC